MLALKSQRTLGQSTFPEVAERAKSLLEVTHRRLKLWDITETTSMIWSAPARSSARCRSMPH